MKLSAETAEAMRSHAVETFPDECCGVLIGNGDGSVSVVRITNVQNEMHAKDPERYPRSAAIAYCGHPGELRCALEQAESPGHSLLAFYHSHPDHEAYFSDEDVAQATPLGEPSYPEAAQIVISVFDRRVRDIKAFAWSPQEATYAEVAVEIAG